MDSFSYLAQGFLVALKPLNLGVAFAGSFIGTIVGLLPVAFAMKLPPETALILLAAVYIGCEYGGRISSILLNIPGDAGAVMTAVDGYPMARNGLAGVALSISAWSSFVGSVIATIGLALFAPIIANWALSFGPAEQFVLMVFALCCLAGMVGDRPVKTVLAAAMGLGLATVGMDANSGVYRFTFDSVHLGDGVQFIVVVIGLFSVSEMLIMLEQSHAGQSVIKASGRKLFNLKEMAATWWGTVRSSLVGFVIGVLPGAGATVASAITYMMERSLTDKDGTFGKGDVRGVAAPEAANNAAAHGAFIPMLTLGIPGSGTTAVMIGALTLYNITPGPLLFQQQPDLVWGLIASMFIGNVILLILNIPMVGFFARMLHVPNWLLVPAIAAVSFVGVYAVHATTFDLVFMVVLGVIGWLLRKLGFPMVPLILGFVLGDMMEQNLRRALSISNGSLEILYASPITWVLWGLAALVIAVPLGMRRRRRSLVAEAAGG